MKRFLSMTIFLCMTLFMSSVTASASVASSSEQKAPHDVGKNAINVSTNDTFGEYTVTSCDLQTGYAASFASWHVPASPDVSKEQTVNYVLNTRNSPAGLYSWRLCDQGTVSNFYRSSKRNYYITLRKDKHQYKFSSGNFLGFERYWCYGKGVAANGAR